MNEDRSFYESRGSHKKVKDDLENDAPQKLADLSLMWEKMTGSTTGKILQSKNHEPNAMVKGALMSRIEKSYRNSEHQENGMHEVLYQILWQLFPRRLQG